MIGRTYDDPMVQEDKKLWPFGIVNVRDKLKIQVTYKEEERTFFPEEISSFVLSKMKLMAEEYLGYPVTNTVITVPAYFNDSQREATKDAGVISGLNVLRIISEPTAAAIAYGFDESLENESKRILVYDLGGGTFDISILAIENEVYDVLAVAGDTHLGGQDFDNRMVQFVADEFERKFNKKITSNKRSMCKLRVHCERAKRSLSSAKEITIAIESLFEGIDFQIKLTRVRFESLNLPLFESTIACVEGALKDAMLKKSEIDEVILVGGSTRIPKIQELLREYFNGKVLNQKINPDEAVANGAAIQAAILNGDYKCGNIQLHDVIPKSLGIETRNDKTMSIVVKRNTPIPVKKTEVFVTQYDNQTSVAFKVYEGEHMLTSFNHRLGDFTIHGVPKGPAGKEKFDCTFEIDSNGILKVTAVNHSTGITRDIVIDKKRLNNGEMREIIESAEALRRDDIRNNQKVEAKSNLEGICFRIKVLLDQIVTKRPEHLILSKVCLETIDWLDMNDNLNNLSPEDYKIRHKILSDMSQDIFSNISDPFGTLDIPD